MPPHDTESAPPTISSPQPAALQEPHLAVLAQVGQRLVRCQEAAEVVLHALDGLKALVPYDYALLELIPGFGRSGIPTVFRATPEAIEAVSPASILVDEHALILPLESGGRELGKLRVISAAQHWTAEEETALRALAAYLGLALRQAQLETMLKRLGNQEHAAAQRPAAPATVELAPAGRRVRASTVRAELSQILSAQLGLTSLCDRVLEHFLAALEMDAGAIFTYDERAGDLVRVAQRGVPAPLSARQSVDVDAPTALGRAVAVSAAALVPDVFTAALESDQDRVLRTWGFHTLLCFPLQAGKRRTGALQLMSRRTNALTPEALRLLEALGDELALALQNALVFERLSTMAVTDSLTGLHNRRFCEEFVRKHLLAAQRTKRPCGFLLLDIDHFKSYNDRFGHAVGDAVLRRVATTVVSSVRAADLAGRFGGEEFMVCLPNTDLRTTLVVAERIRANIQEMPVSVGTVSERVTVSIGVTSFPECAADLDQLFTGADTALYAAKGGGRNRVVAASPLVVDPSAPTSTE